MTAFHLGCVMCGRYRVSGGEENGVQVPKVTRQQPPKRNATAYKAVSCSVMEAGVIPRRR